MAAKWLKEKGIILEDLRKFIVATEKYLSHQKVLYENRQNDNDYLQQLGRKLTWDMKRKLILQELGIDYQIIGSILVCLAREDENKANCKLEELKKRSTAHMKICSSDCKHCQQYNDKWAICWHKTIKSSKVMIGTHCVVDLLNKEEQHSWGAREGGNG